MDRRVPPTPVLVDLPRHQGDIPEAGGQAWWFASRLTGEGRTFFFHQCTVTAREPDPVAVTWSAIREVGTALHETQTLTLRLDEVELGNESLDVRTPHSSASGDLDKFSLSAVLPVAQIALDLEPDRRILYNCGTGSYDFHDGVTFQYSLPGIPTSGAVEIEGEAIAVSGETWYDRQWWTDKLPDKPMKWFGLVLDTGEVVSMFDTTPWGGAWATVGHPDGSTTVAVVEPYGNNKAGLVRRPDGILDLPQKWSVTIPLFDARLDLTQELLLQNGNLYNASVDVGGMWRGRPVSGRGWFDVALSPNQ